MDWTNLKARRRSALTALLAWLSLSALAFLLAAVFRSTVTVWLFGVVAIAGFAWHLYSYNRMLNGRCPKCGLWFHRGPGGLSYRAILWKICAFCGEKMDA